jgi:hypothetical protein
MNATLRKTAGAAANQVSLGRATPASPFRHAWLGQGPALRGLSMSCVLAALWGCTASVDGGAPPGAGATPGGGGTSSMGSSGASGTATGGAASTVGTPLEVKLNGAPVYSRFVRLTNDQWENAARDLLRFQAAPGLASTFEGAPPGGTFSNNERRLFITSGLSGDYQLAAEALSQRLMQDATALSKVTAGATTAAAFIPAFGRRAYRRDLTAAEVTRYTTLFNGGADIFKSGNAFNDGVQMVVETMLKSPYFLYRAEIGQNGQPLSGYEVATKLSFLLRNTMPDDALLDLAKSGGLNSPEQIKQQAQSMLETPESRSAFERFHSELFGIDRYANIEKDATLFPTFNPAMATDFGQADTNFFDYLYDNNLGFKDLLLSQVGFVNASTAPIYGQSASGSGFVQVLLGPDRPGYFTRAGFLANNGTLIGSDPIRRGVDVIRRIFGNADFSPPGGVVIPPLPAPMPGQTTRERVTAHTGNGTCGASCHGQYINPLGFSFENFDAIGQLRSMDNGKPVDTTGDFPFASGSKSFKDAPSLLALMATDAQTNKTYAAHLAEYVLARDMAEADGAFLDTLGQSSAAAGSIKQLTLTVISSDAFSKRGTP